MHRLSKKHSYDIRVSFILRVQAEEDNEALEIAQSDVVENVHFGESYKKNSLEFEIDDEDTGDEEPEYNPEDEWEKEDALAESLKEDANGYSEDMEPPEPEEDPADRYDYVADDIAFDSERERRSF